LSSGFIRLAPGVASIRSLGATTFEDFFRAPGAPDAPGFERARTIESRDGREVLLVPLDNAPGDGFARVVRYTSCTWRDACRARLTHPRSTSLAEREWNLVCRARSLGIGAPEPLAVGRGEGDVFAQRSFLVVRELEGMLSLREWLRTPLDASHRSQIASALGGALARLFAAGIWLPHLTADDICIGPPRNAAGADPDCIARSIAALQGDIEEVRASVIAGALRWGSAPEVAFTAFRDGRMVRSVSLARRLRLLRSLERDLRPIDRRTRLRIACAAVGPDAWRAVARAGCA
jgi:hypothetical protein